MEGEQAGSSVSRAHGRQQSRQVFLSKEVLGRLDEVLTREDACF